MIAEGRLAKSMEYLSWHYAMAAVLAVFKENQTKEGIEDAIKACADIWATNDELRHEIWQRARRHWCRKSGRDDTQFPYSVDFVSLMYFKIRKRRQDEVEGFEREIEEAFAVDQPSLFGEK